MKGGKSNASKLTEDDVRLIRQLHAFRLAEMKKLDDALSINALAEKFEVHPCTIEKVLQYVTWKHVRG